MKIRVTNCKCRSWLNHKFFSLALQSMALPYIVTTPLDTEFERYALQKLVHLNKVINFTSKTKINKIILSRWVRKSKKNISDFKILNPRLWEDNKKKFQN